MATQPYGQQSSYNQQFDHQNQNQRDQQQQRVRQQRELSKAELAEYANNCKILASVSDNFARRILEDEVQRATQALVQDIQDEGRGSQQYRGGGNRDDQQMRS